MILKLYSQKTNHGIGLGEQSFDIFAPVETPGWCQSQAIRTTSGTAAGKWVVIIFSFVPFLPDLPWAPAAETFPPASCLVTPQLTVHLVLINNYYPVIKACHKFWQRF